MKWLEDFYWGGIRKIFKLFFFLLFGLPARLIKMIVTKQKKQDPPE